MPPAAKWLLVLPPVIGGLLFFWPKSGPPPLEEIPDPVRSALSRLEEAPDRPEALRTLGDLRTLLADMPTARAVAWIRSFLESGEDRGTGLSFGIGAGGTLEECPTLRVFLLDTLLALDPAAAAGIGREILSSPTTADEWAVALRNVARGESGDNAAYLQAKTEELIRNPAWRVNPSIGFFESFDVLVHTRSTQSTGLLSDLVSDRSPQGKPLAHAAFLTLDRLTFREPAAMMEQLAARPELSQVRGEMVANLFARADLRDHAQKQLVRTYLLDSDRTAAELAAFAGIYPNANFSISKNLLSENLTLSRDEITVRDAAALEVVGVWLADPSFAPVKPHLFSIQQRLETFVSQANE